MGGSVGDLVHTAKNMLTGEDQTNAAIDAQRSAAGESNATQKYIYDQTRQDQQPWLQAGQKALGDLQGQMGDLGRMPTMSDLQIDPGFAFRMQQGQQALERSAAAKGGLASGGTLKSLTDYAQGSASQEYQNAYNRFTGNQQQRFGQLSSLAGVGQNALAQQSAAGQNYGNNVSQTQMGLGNAIGAAQIGQANRMSGLIGQGAMAGAMAFSDERLKNNIKLISKEDIKELRSTLKPYLFNYIDDTHGKGDWVGVMAQDLIKSKLGRSVVCEDSRGFKQVDMTKLSMLLLATLAEAA